MTDTTAADLTEGEADANALNAYRAQVEALTKKLADERRFHELRSDALNRTGADNDQLRAKVARVEALPSWAACDIAPHEPVILAIHLTAALADQEPARD